MSAQLSIPTLLGYGVVVCMLVVALSHVLELGARRKAFMSRCGRDPSDLHLSDGGNHPTDAVLRRAIAEPELAGQPSAAEAWIEEAVFDAIGDLAVRMDRLKSLGPLFGFTGSVTGLILGLVLFADDMDTARLFESAGLALVTTLGGTLVAVVEVWAIKSWLAHLEVRLRTHATRALAAFQARPRGRRTARRAAIELPPPALGPDLVPAPVRNGKGAGA